MFEAVRVRPHLGIASLFVFGSVWGGPVPCDGVAARVAAPTPSAWEVCGAARVLPADSVTCGDLDSFDRERP